MIIYSSDYNWNHWSLKNVYKAQPIAFAIGFLIVNKYCESIYETKAFNETTTYP